MAKLNRKTLGGLVFLALLAVANGFAVCTDGIVVNEYVSQPFECCRIICPKGHQAMWCQPGNKTSSWCQPCTGELFNDNISVLGFNDKCHFKQKCDEKYKFVLDNGSSTRDRVCGCEPGHTLNPRNNICYTVDDAVENLNEKTTQLKWTSTKAANVGSNAKKHSINSQLLSFLLILSIVLCLYL